MDQLFPPLFIKRIVKNPLIFGSGIIFIGSLIANICNYIFNLAMGRLLTESEFGLLTALNSLLILVGIFSVAFTNVIAKFSAKYFGLNDEKASSEVFRIGLKFVLFFSSILLILLTIMIPFLGEFLHSDNYFYIFLIILSIFFSLLFALPAGFIQGRMRFYLLSVIAISQPLLRLVIAVVLILAGFSLLGPFLGLVLSVAIPAIALLIYAYKKYAKKSSVESLDKELYKKEFIHFTYTYFLSGIGLTLLSNSDIILVRHFFSPLEAGQYAALSLMGKAIFYFTIPISTVFFPLIAYQREKKEGITQTLFLAVGAVASISGVLSLAYFFFPQLVLKVFFPKPGYSVLSEYLGYYSLYILVFAVASLINIYFLSIGKTKVYIITLIGAAVQIVSIVLFHSSLLEVIVGLFTASSVMLLLLIIYYLKHGEN